MSNYLAIATVTAALQQLLQAGIREDVPGANVTTLRPDNPGVMNLSVGINVYLYQATPNPAWRNADLRTRRPKGDLIKHGQAGLDLHYLLTFYGNDQELEPQRLMGSAIKTLVDNPTLTQNAIRNTIDRSNLSCLTGSTLDDQVQLVQFIPSSITTEDMSRIWSVFFQVPYSLSFAYQGMAVLIEGDRPGDVSLPVRKRYFLNNSYGRPEIEQVTAENLTENFITINSRLIIKGRNFLKLRVEKRILFFWWKYYLQVQDEISESSQEYSSWFRSLCYWVLSWRVTQVQIGAARVTPHEVTETRITIDLPSLAVEEASLLRAGMQGIQVIHPPPCNPRSIQTEVGVESNAKPLVLCATIPREVLEIFEGLREEDEDCYQGGITIPTDIFIGPTQRVFLILNGLSEESPKSYIFRASRRIDSLTTASFPITSVVADTYLVRIQIDGAESPLFVSEFGETQEYAGPTVTIP
jgi:hypothetical protein